MLVPPLLIDIAFSFVEAPLTHVSVNKSEVGGVIFSEAACSQECFYAKTDGQEYCYFRNAYVCCVIFIVFYLF